MIEFRGTYFDGQNSKAHAVNVRADGPWLYLSGDTVNLQVRLDECKIEPVLGKTRRVFRLPGEARLETEDLAGVAELETQLGRNPGMTLVNRLESRWRWVLVSLVGLLVFVWVFFRFGLPYVAELAAFATPIRVAQGVSDQTLRLIDDQFMDPSQLPATRRAKLEADFRQLVGQIGGNYPYRLEFRQSPILGANAFALPSGTIVLTDELIQLAQSDREIIGVMAHEVGHVVRRHGLRSVYQSAGVVLMASLLIGDVTSVTNIAASLPTLLITTGYSREFEREADAVAGQYLIAQGWGTRPLRDILQRLTLEAGGDGGSSFLDSHPGTDERVKNLEQLERERP